VAWPSFLVASVATMVCFGFIDPVLSATTITRHRPSRRALTGYAVGFFFFWLIAALSSLMSLYLVRTAKSRTGRRGD